MWLRLTKTTTEYRVAPLRLRIRWWIEGWIWRWGQTAAALHAESPDLQHPFWRR
ncbi:MAG: hypothetical protein J7456_02850 [Chloroflexus sp.]|jgi:hypothetical protein|nr:hypothetical protein [Chloroflexus sp.]MBO9314710.1 hypothetical protein [Chloroflexus sp.]MBO9319005.1 hypothetical protein [Chloroflexus sp.]MBO9339983.1 hypothetical protein [Chloroflexus sp.]MBO9374309.1 hypothetical protein [Chloroflexus sp.]